LFCRVSGRRAGFHFAWKFSKHCHRRASGASSMLEQTAFSSECLPQRGVYQFALRFLIHAISAYGPRLCCAFVMFPMGNGTARTAKLGISMAMQTVFGNDVAIPPNQQPLYVAPQHTLHFAGGAKICYR
jgi:hypothetical protein